jgi:hypothetical protein
MSVVMMRFRPHESGPDEITVEVSEGNRFSGLLMFTREGWIKFGTVLTRSNAIIGNWHAEIETVRQMPEVVKED